MARARNIKPGFFKNELLAELPFEARLLFIGLWTLADREGRLEDRPRRIGAELFPLDRVDVDSMLSQLHTSKFVVRYEAKGGKYIQVENFVKHQDPHYREKASEIPAPSGKRNAITAINVTRSQRSRILERDGFKCQSCQSEKQLCIDHILPVSRGGDSTDENLQVLCLSCNTAKGNRVSSKVESTSIRTSPNVGPTQAPDVPLIPDSLIPDSLIPDSPSSDSLTPDSGFPSVAGKPAALPAPKERGDAPPSKTAAVWDAYAAAYLRRYTVEPTRNGTVNGQLAHFVARVPIAEAPDIAAFYVRHNKSFYVSKKHPVGLMLQDAEGLRTEWLSGRMVTDSEARQIDQTAGRGNVWGKLIEEAKERERT